MGELGEMIDKIVPLNTAPANIEELTTQLKTISELLTEIRDILQALFMWNQYICLIVFIIFVLMVCSKILSFIDGILNYF